MGSRALAAVLLDRDGTINLDSGYVCEPQTVELIDGVWEGIAILKRAGFLVIVVSNQSAVGRGLGTIADVDATNDEITKQLLRKNEHAVVDAMFYCPHHPDQGCDCRKPQPGLFRQVQQQWNIDPQQSWMIGDKLRDLEFAGNIGIPPEQQILVLTGEGQVEFKRSQLEKRQVLVQENLQEAAKIIVSRCNSGKKCEKK